VVLMAEIGTLLIGTAGQRIGNRCLHRVNAPGGSVARYETVLTLIPEELP
jgi:hypothetical protein